MDKYEMDKNKEVPCTLTDEEKRLCEDFVQAFYIMVNSFAKLCESYYKRNGENKGNGETNKA